MAIIATITKIKLIAFLVIKRSSHSPITYFVGLVRSKRPVFPAVTVELVRPGPGEPTKETASALESRGKEEPLESDAENALTFSGGAPLVRSG
jgi:hypothetical protein